MSEWLARGGVVGGRPIIPWISGVCTWRVSVFCAKKHFPARRVRKFDNTVFFHFIVRVLYYCYYIYIYFSILSSLTKKPIVIRSSANFRFLCLFRWSPLKKKKKQLLLLITEAREFHGPRASAFGQFNRGLDVRSRTGHQSFRRRYRR